MSLIRKKENKSKFKIFIRSFSRTPELFGQKHCRVIIRIVGNMKTLAEGFLVTNYHDGGHKVSKSSLDQGRKQKRSLCQTAVDA